MTFGQIDWVAVAAAAVASFAFGAAYYMSLAKPWMAAVGKSEAEIKANQSAVPFIVSGVAELVMACVLSLAGAGAGIVEGLTVGFLAWLGFVLTTLTVNHRYQGQRLALTVIDGGHWLGVLLIQGLVIGAIAG